MIDEGRLQVNGIEMNVAQAGSGTPVVLLHGFPDSWRVWRHQISALAEAGYHVIAPDLRGFGGTDRPRQVEDYRLEASADDVVALLAALGIEGAPVVGHDWGAALAWRLAMAAPTRVTRLVALSVGHPQAAAAAGLRQLQRWWYMLWFLFPGVPEQVLPADDWAFYRRWAWGGAERGTDPDLDRQLADLTREGALTAGLNWYRANIDPARFVNDDPTRLRLPPVTCPTMGVWSSRDMALAEEQMSRSGEFVAGPWRYERIDAVDHWIPVHAPERLTGLLLDFLG